MTTQDVEHGQGRSLGDDAEHDPLRDLFEHSPARPVRTSAAATAGFLAGLVAVLTAPFELTLALSLGLGAFGVLACVLGLARASRPTVAGGLLASMGLLLALAALALTGLRYLGVDTAFGTATLPVLTSWLEWLNTLVPVP